MNKSERDELRRLIRARFKVLRADVEARKAELEVELMEQIKDRFAGLDKQYDDVQFKLKLIVDDANRQANDLGRELYGRETWGEKYDRQVIAVAKEFPRPGSSERYSARREGAVAIDARVKNALRELERRENELLTELAVSALESTEALQFFSRIPTATELVPAYRLAEITGGGL